MPPVPLSDAVAHVMQQFRDADYVSEADREASLFLEGREVHLSPAARTIVEERLRRDPVVFAIHFIGEVRPWQAEVLRAAASGQTLMLDLPLRRKFKHNRRG